jgi:hypothetical protein
MTEAPRILHPKARRPFELPSNDSSQPSTPPSGEISNNAGMDLLDVKNDLAAKRTGSLLNLTSSTLLGIFSPTAFEGPRDEDSPWDTQVHTPSERASADLRYQPTSHPAGTERQRPSFARKHSRRHAGDVYVPLVLKSSLLFVCGVAYGTIMAHLHENHWITPVKLELIDGSSYRYLGLWGIGGVALAFVLPWLDTVWEKSTNVPGKDRNLKAGNQKKSDSRSSRWTLAVRSIGAFVGIAFALVSTYPSCSFRFSSD